MDATRKGEGGILHFSEFANVLGLAQKAEYASGKKKNPFRCFLFKEIIISRDKFHPPFPNPTFFFLEKIFFKTKYIWTVYKVLRG